MSSLYIRTQVKAFIASDIPSETVVDLTAQYKTLQDMLDDVGVGILDSWLGLQFIGTNEEPITVNSNNTGGCYRETGSLFLHVVSPAKNSAADDIINRTETIRNAFRGQRINDIIIDGVTPPNFESSGTLQFDDGFTSASIIVDFYRDLNF